jgi:dCMP deaminase
MAFACALAQRSTCARKQVGAVVTDALGLQVLGIGYNGNARGLPNRCDTDIPGACGCLHAEINALLKAPGTIPGKTLYSTMEPCAVCAKAIINSGVVRVVYAEAYRDHAGLTLLIDAGVHLLFLPLRPPLIRSYVPLRP